MDSKYINRCFELAKKGTGKVSPNPLVGCVIVKNGEVVGEGWHEEFGNSHAEINAFKNCITSPGDSTLYCNLEPCSHTNKKTPPCVPEIIKQKISKVVISNIDPNPDVNGKGIEQLRESGIEVVTGIEEERGKELNRIFFKYVKTKIPYVILKLAQTADGKITEVNGKQSWITGKEAGEFVHRQRGIFDAVLVGANSVIVDDPMLTVRHIEGRNPIRIILDGKLSMPESAKVISNDKPENTWIVTGNAANADKKNLLKQKGIRIFEFQVNGKKNIDLNELLKQLGSNNISSVLVEGGRQVFSQFIEQELFDELVVLQSSKIFGKGLDSVSLSKTINLKMKDAEKLGEDLKIIYERV